MVELAYVLVSPTVLASFHQIIHVSMLKKFLGDPASILPIEDLWVDVNFSYKEVPV